MSDASQRTASNADQETTSNEGILRWSALILLLVLTVCVAYIAFDTYQRRALFDRFCKACAAMR
jgi:hypothetical protein